LIAAAFSPCSLRSRFRRSRSRGSSASDGSPGGAVASTDDVRRDALGPGSNGPWACVVARHGQLQAARLAAAAVEIDHRLHRSLAERLRPENDRAVVILQRARDDLGGRRGRAVDEDDHREAE
jgi:hypothetical protein